MLSRFDRDSSGSLDTSEAERARRLFAALKTLDTDKDGAISDSEASSAKLGKDGRRKGRKGTR